MSGGETLRKRFVSQRRARVLDVIRFVNLPTVRRHRFGALPLTAETLFKRGRWAVGTRRSTVNTAG